MTDCIEREPLLAWLSNMSVSENIINTINDKDRFPAADVTEVRHGSWRSIDKQQFASEGHWTERYLQCSVCNYERRHSWLRGEKPTYCENCGSKMDKEN